MNQEIRIRLESYDHRLLDETVKAIVDISSSNGLKVRGPIPLPTKKEVFTILRSPHVNKSSREQFERRTHKRLVILENSNAKAREAIKRLNIPSGVHVSFKL